MFLTIFKYYEPVLLKIPRTGHAIIFFIVEAKTFSVTPKIILFCYGYKNEQRRLHP